MPKRRATHHIRSTLGYAADALAERTRSAAGLLGAAPAPLVALTFSARATPPSSGLAVMAALGLVVGLTLVLVGAVALDAGRRSALLRRLDTDWGRAGLAGAMAAVVTGLVYLVAGPSPGWSAGVLGLAAVTMWAISAQLATAKGQRPFLVAPVVALVALLLIMAGGHAARAGITYYLGPPLAYCVVLGGHYLAFCGRENAAPEGAVVTMSYIMGSAAMAIAAWVDLL